jgi:hypothetical protein
MLHQHATGQVILTYSGTRLQRLERYFMPLSTSAIINEDHIVMVNSEEFVGTTECLTLYARFRINRCRYNRVQPHFSTPLRTQKTHPYVVAWQEIETELLTLETAYRRIRCCARARVGRLSFRLVPGCDSRTNQAYSLFIF